MTHWHWLPQNYSSARRGLIGHSRSVVRDPPHVDCDLGSDIKLHKSSFLLIIYYIDLFTSYISSSYCFYSLPNKFYSYMPMKGGRKSYPLWSWTQKWNMKRSEVAKIEVSKVFSSFHMNFIYCSTSSIGMILAALQIASISSTYYPSPRDGSLCSLFSIKNVNIYTRELCKLWFFFFLSSIFVCLVSSNIIHKYWKLF